MTPSPQGHMLPLLLFQKSSDPMPVSLKHTPKSKRLSQAPAPQARNPEPSTLTLNPMFVAQELDHLVRDSIHDVPGCMLARFPVKPGLSGC